MLGLLGLDVSFLSLLHTCRSHHCRSHTCLTVAERRCKLNTHTHVSLFTSGWNKASLSLDASEEHDGFSSAEDPLNSDPEDDNGKKLVSRCVWRTCVSLSVPVSVTMWGLRLFTQSDYGDSHPIWGQWEDEVHV